MTQASPTLASAAEIIAFWREAGPEKWFNKDEDFDAAIRGRFLDTHLAAAAGKLSDWEATPEGAYALLLLLDQFPRNLFRGSAQSFATDEQALGIAERAIAKGFNKRFEGAERRFFYLPHMHSEKLVDQERCIALCEEANDPEGVKFAIIHRDIIRDFGRFPHRNPVLGRQTTQDEKAFLDAGGFSG